MVETITLSGDEVLDVLNTVEVLDKNIKGMSNFGVEKHGASFVLVGQKVLEDDYVKSLVKKHLENKDKIGEYKIEFQNGSAICTKVEITPETEDDKMKKLLLTPIEDLDSSIRLNNCFRANEFKILADVVKKKNNEILELHHFGKKSLAELKGILTEKGLTLGMDVKKYGL